MAEPKPSVTQSQPPSHQGFTTSQQLDAQSFLKCAKNNKHFPTYITPQTEAAIVEYIFFDAADLHRRDPASRFFRFGTCAFRFVGNLYKTDLETGELVEGIEFPPPFHKLVDDVLFFVFGILLKFHGRILEHRHHNGFPNGFKFELLVPPLSAVNLEPVYLPWGVRDDPVIARRMNATITIMMLNYLLVSLLGPVDSESSIFRKEPTVVAERWKAGLLRKEQVTLVEISIRKLMIQQYTLLECFRAGVDPAWLKKFRPPAQFQLFDVPEYKTVMEVFWNQFKRVFNRNQSLLKGLLCNERFRSHRLEILLLKYITEDGVNWEVVRGLEKAQRHREIEESEGIEYPLYRPHPGRRQRIIRSRAVGQPIILSFR